MWQQEEVQKGLSDFCLLSAEDMAQQRKKRANSFATENVVFCARVVQLRELVESLLLWVTYQQKQKFHEFT